MSVVPIIMMSFGSRPPDDYDDDDDGLNGCRGIMIAFVISIILFTIAIIVSQTTCR